MSAHRGGSELWGRAAGAVLVLAVLGLVLFVRPGGGDEPAAPDAKPTPTAEVPGPAPSEEEFCHLFRQLADAQAVYAASPDTLGAELVRNTVDDLVDLGVPESMPPEARGGYFTVLDGVYGELGSSLEPGAVPGAADGEQIAGSDAAFATYLDEYCPA